jgi:hypothetical protein
MGGYLVFEKLCIEMKHYIMNFIPFCIFPRPECLFFNQLGEMKGEGVIHQRKSNTELHYFRKPFISSAETERVRQWKALSWFPLSSEECEVEKRDK